ncbi:MAG: cold shock domain-containing protein [Pseudomonadota bacterium]
MGRLEPTDSMSRVIDGSVKWFDPGKGYGFIVADEGGKDILLHANVLRNYGQSSVADGVRVKVQVQETARGTQAIAVLEIAAPEAQPVAELEDISGLSPEDIADLPAEPARVKWFDKAKGFGFANIFGRQDDVFIHIEVLRNSGLADLQAGEAICLRVLDGRRGLMAAAVQSWESAASH